MHFPGAGGQLELVIVQMNKLYTHLQKQTERMTMILKGKGLKELFRTHLSLIIQWPVSSGRLFSLCYH